MLVSPISLDSNTLPGQVPAPASSGAGAAGFAEQLQLAADMAPAEASTPVTLPINGGDASGNGANAIPPAPLIAFHSTAELNLRGVLLSSTVAEPAPQTSAPAPLKDLAEAAAPATPAGGRRVDRGSAPQKAGETLDDDASIPEQKKSEPQPQIAVAAPVALPVHMVLPIVPRFHQPVTPLGNRIPVAEPVRAETPVAADPFHNDADPKAPPLPAEAIKPLVATADQLAFAAKVQVAKPQTMSQRVSETPTTSRPAEPVHSEQQSQQRHDSHPDSDSQFSMKQGETAVKPLVHPTHSTSHFEAINSVAGETIVPAKTASSAMPSRPASATAAHDITPMRPEVPAAPMKDISVRIQSEQGENVDVRILHRAGDVQIAVKSADGDTTQGLRHGLSELTDRLNASGYNADTWHPGHAVTAAENTADSGSSGYSQQQHSQQQQSQGDSQSHSGWSQQQGGRRDDHQSNRPRWIEELESNISSSPETGLFHGLIR